MRDECERPPRVHTFSDGSKYEGNYKNGMRHGHGVYTWAGGDVYVGECQFSEVKLVCDMPGVMQTPTGGTLVGDQLDQLALLPSRSEGSPIYSHSHESGTMGHES